MRALPLLVLALMVAVAAPVAAEPVTISGLVAYREGLRLPPGAETTVRLIEVAAAGDPGEVVAETTVQDRMAPPIPFVLSYDPDAVDEAGAYALEAVITLGERILFMSPAPQPLKPPDRSQQVSLVVGLVRD
ncbi:MAG TPA: YbaY family lipoprotein [Geminicoccaceae bacterium]